jgi:hypothetical protein
MAGACQVQGQDECKARWVCSSLRPQSAPVACYRRRRCATRDPKRLEEGRYRIPWRSEQGYVIVEAAELLLVLEEMM